MCRLKFTILFTDKAAGGVGGRLLAGRTGSTVTVRDTDGDVDGDGSVRKKQR